MPTKLTFEYVKKIFEDAECILISTEYVNRRTQLEYICSCSNDEINKIYYQDFLCGIRCSKCRNERFEKTMMAKFGVKNLSQHPDYKKKMLSGITKYVEEKKHKIENIKIYFEEQGCTLLSTEYNNIQEKLKYICICGKQWKTEYSSFRAGKRCGDTDCMNKRKQQTCLERYNFDNYSKTEESKERIKETCIEKYGTTYYTQSKEYKEKLLKTSREKYGCDHFTQSKEFRDKLKAFNLKNYGTEHFFQTDKFKDLNKLQNLDKYDVEYYAQTEEFKSKCINTNIKNYGVPYTFQAVEVKNKIIETNMAKYGVKYGLMNTNIRRKATNTIMDIYGVDNVSKNPEIQQKKKDTSRTRYGVDYPMQDPTIADKSSRNALNTKDYTLPSGKIIKIQGFEKFALDILYKKYDESDILLGTVNMPEIWYFDNKYRRYYPDIYIPKDNLIIEVKSIYTYEKNFNEVNTKRLATQALGYTFKMIIFDKYGNILKGDL